MNSITTPITSPITMSLPKHSIPVHKSSIPVPSAIETPKYPQMTKSMLKGNYLQFARNTYLDTLLNALFDNGIISQEYIENYPKGKANTADKTRNDKTRNIINDIKKTVLANSEKLIIELSLN